MQPREHSQPEQEHSQLHSKHSPHLPQATAQLIHLFHSCPQTDIRIAALAKVKNQLLFSLPSSCMLPQTSEGIQCLFSRAVLDHVGQGRDYSAQGNMASRLFLKVVSLAVKYYFSEEAFKGMLAEVTGLLEGHAERVEPALFLFAQIITTIEEDSMGQKGGAGQQGTIQSGGMGQRQPRCHFEGYLVSQHINSMVTLGNYCLERGVLPGEINMEDGPGQEIFRLIAPEETLTAALQLVRVCLRFDWHQQGSQSEEDAEMTMLLLPLKRAKGTADNQFEKWIRNSEWVRLYQFLFQQGHSVQLRVEVVELLGDLARTHIKFFRTKANYRAHLESLMYAFCSVLEQLQICRDSQQTIEVALALGTSLNKLLTPATRAIFFEVSANLWKGLLYNVQQFILHQIIGEEVFNCSLLYYYFSFLEGVLARSRFEPSNTSAFESVEDTLREICRSYEHYLRLLLNRIRRSPIKTSEASYYRLDYLRLREALGSYDWRELEVYFLPFRLMRPRYFSINTIYELFIFVTARVARSLSLLEMFQMEPWEIEKAYSMLIEAIAKLKERFGFTSFKRVPSKHRNREAISMEGEARQSESQCQPCPLPPICEHYDQEIENEEEYCHVLRLCLFLLMDLLSEKSPAFLLKLACPLLRLVILVVEVCLCADLQEPDSQERREPACMQKIRQGLQMLPLLCRKVLLREYERQLLNLTRFQQYPGPICYRYEFTEDKLDFFDFELETENTRLLETLAKVLPAADSDSRPPLIELAVMAAICLPASVIQVKGILLESMESCTVSLQALASMEILGHLIRHKHAGILVYLGDVLLWLEEKDHGQDQLFLRLRILRLLSELKAPNLSEEATNTLFVLLKCLLPSFKESPDLSDQLNQELACIADGILSEGHQCDFQQLRRQLLLLVAERKEPERIEMETTCLSLSVEAGNSDENDRMEIETVQPIEIEDEEEKNEKEKEKENEKEEDNNEKKGRKEIYQGYHRDSTLNIVNKYLDEETMPPGQIRLHIDTRTLVASGHIDQDNPEKGQHSSPQNTVSQGHEGEKQKELQQEIWEISESNFKEATDSKNNIKGIEIGVGVGSQSPNRSKRVLLLVSSPSQSGSNKKDPSGRGRRDPSGSGKRGSSGSGKSARRDPTGSGKSARRDPSGSGRKDGSSLIRSEFS